MVCLPAYQGRGGGGVAGGIAPTVGTCCRVAWRIVGGAMVADNMPARLLRARGAIAVSERLEERSDYPGVELRARAALDLIQRRD